MRILIVDDHSLFLDALKVLLEQKKNCAEISILPDSQKIKDHLNDDCNYDLVIIDLKMPQINGIDLMCDIKKDFPHLKIAIISGFAQAEDIINAKDQGAVAFFPKTITGDALNKAIDLVLDGEQYFPQQTDYYLPCISNDDKLATYAETVPLSPREKELSSYLSHGLTNKEIAKAMILSPSTIKLYLKNIYNKINVRNRGQAIARIKGFHTQNDQARN